MTALTATAAHLDEADRVGPSVVIIDRTNDITHMSPGTQVTLDRLLGGTHAAATVGMLFGMVARARQYAAGRTTPCPGCEPPPTTANGSC